MTCIGQIRREREAVGREPVTRRSPLRTALGLLLVIGAGACSSSPHEFDVAIRWDSASLRDMTGLVIALHEAVLPADVMSQLPSEPALRNVSADRIEIEWVGGVCRQSPRFLLSTESEVLTLAFDLGSTCQTQPATPKAFDISFSRPVDAASIRSVERFLPAPTGGAPAT